MEEVCLMCTPIHTFIYKTYYVYYLLEVLNVFNHHLQMPYNLPYSEYVDADPTFEDMKSVVYIKVNIIYDIG